MGNILEVSVEGLACRLTREALVQAVEASDPAAVVQLDPASGHVCAETALELGAFLLAIQASGCRLVIPA